MKSKKVPYCIPPKACNLSNNELKNIGFKRIRNHLYLVESMIISLLPNFAHNARSNCAPNLLFMTTKSPFPTFKHFYHVSRHRCSLVTTEMWKEIVHLFTRIFVHATSTHNDFSPMSLVINHHIYPKQHLIQRTVMLMLGTWFSKKRLDFASWNVMWWVLLDMNHLVVVCSVLSMDSYHS